MTGSSSVTASFTPEQLMSQINTLINSFKQGNIQLGNLRNKLIELGATCIIIDPNLYGNTYVRFQGPDGKNYEITTNSAAPDSYRENLRKDVEQNKDEYYSSVSSKITKEIFDIRFEELLNSASYDELRNFDKYFEENIFIKNTNNITQDIIKITQQLKEHYEKEYSDMFAFYPEGAFDDIYNNIVTLITDLYEGNKLSLIALSTDLENLLPEAINDYLYYRMGDEETDVPAVNRVKATNNKANIDKTDNVSPLNYTLNVNGAKVTVKSCAQIDNYGNVVFPNNIAAHITIVINGKETIIPLQMNIEQGGIKDSETNTIFYYERMKRVNDVMKQSIDSIFQNINIEALEIFTKECSVLKLNTRQYQTSVEQTGSRGNFEPETKDSVTDAQIISTIANRINLVVDYNVEADDLGRATKINVLGDSLQTTLIHETGHGVDFYNKSTVNGGINITEFTSSSNWEEIFRDIQNNYNYNNEKYDYILKDSKDNYQKAKMEFFAEYFAYKYSGTSAYSEVFKDLEKNYPEIYTKLNNVFNEIINEASELDDNNRKYDDSYQYGKDVLKDFEHTYIKILDQLKKLNKNQYYKYKDHMNNIQNKMMIFFDYYNKSYQDLEGIRVDGENYVDDFFAECAANDESFNLSDEDLQFAKRVLNTMMEEYFKTKDKSNIETPKYQPPTNEPINSNNNNNNVNNKPNNTQNNTGNTSNIPNNNNDSTQSDMPTSPTLENAINHQPIGPSGIYGPSSSNSSDGDFDFANHSSSSSSNNINNNSSGNAGTTTGVESNNSSSQNNNNSYNNPINSPINSNSTPINNSEESKKDQNVTVSYREISEKLSNLQWTTLEVGEQLIVVVTAPEGCDKTYLQVGQPYSWEAAGIEYSWDGLNSITATYKEYVVTGSLSAPPEPTATEPAIPTVSGTTPSF